MGGEPRSMPCPVTAVVLTKNEAAAIRACLDALDFLDQVIVIDSESEDRTVEISNQMGAAVVQFHWNGRYPKKKQWGMDHSSIRNDWVLLLDADEIVTPDLAREVREFVEDADSHGGAALDIPLAYRFAGVELRHGHRVFKRSLVDRRRCRFPEIGDLHLPGITEVEGHYQPQCDGPVLRAKSRLVHDDPDPVHTWIARHNRYSDWEAHLKMESDLALRTRGARSPQGRIFDRMPAKAPLFFVYSFVVRGGFLDGRAGFDYAIALSWYYWLTSLKVRELRGSGERHGSSPARPRRIRTASRR